MKNLNTSSVNVVMKELIESSVNDIYRKIENNYINNTETPENIYNKVIINTKITYDAKLIGGNIKKMRQRGAEADSGYINYITNFLLNRDNFANQTPLNLSTNDTNQTVGNNTTGTSGNTTESSLNKDPNLDVSDKCKALSNEIDKLKNELETTKNKLNIIDQNNLWDNLLKDGNPS